MPWSTAQIVAFTVSPAAAPATASVTCAVPRGSACGGAVSVACKARSPGSTWAAAMPSARIGVRADSSAVPAATGRMALTAT